MKDSKLYVIKFSNGLYSYGYKQFGLQLRKAQIYVSKKMAEDQAKHYISMEDRYTGKKLIDADNFEIVEIMLLETSQIESKADQISKLANIASTDCGKCATCPYIGRATDSIDCTSLFIANSIYAAGFRKVVEEISNDT